MKWKLPHTTWSYSHEAIFSLSNVIYIPQAENFGKQTTSPVMVISYEMFIRCAQAIKELKFDLLICDEGHRLKNANIKTASLLGSIGCRRRILLTGTPLQNDIQVRNVEKTLINITAENMACQMFD